MASTIMIVWLTPIMIDGWASGSCTLKSVWRGVAPNATAASTVSAATRRMPRSVRRITGGMA
ncbi:MAG: hypothetical protein R3A10_20915 [Caldilineaceae bacterium]